MYGLTEKVCSYIDGDEVESVEAPPFSPLSEADFTTDDVDGDDMESVEAPSFSPLSEAIEEECMEELGISLTIEIDVYHFIKFFSYLYFRNFF